MDDQAMTVEFEGEWGEFVGKDDVAKDTMTGDRIQLHDIDRVERLGHIFFFKFKTKPFM